MFQNENEKNQIQNIANCWFAGAKAVIKCDHGNETNFVWTSFKLAFISISNRNDAVILEGALVIERFKYSNSFGKSHKLLDIMTNALITMHRLIVLYYIQLLFLIIEKSQYLFAIYNKFLDPLIYVISKLQL